MYMTEAAYTRICIYIYIYIYIKQWTFYICFMDKSEHVNAKINSVHVFYT